jgi:hypothetical protein
LGILGATIKENTTKAIITTANTPKEKVGNGSPQILTRFSARKGG